MKIRFEDWVFDVDLSATMNYYAQEVSEHCTCGYCRNFYAAVDDRYPNLRSFLAEFGVHIEAPDELCLYEPTIMDGYYAVCGEIIHHGRQPICIDGLSIVAEAGDLNVNSGCPAPVFFLHTGFIELPWVLDEPQEEVLSTANLPDFFDRIVCRTLCSLSRDDEIQ
jgi:hypothetical protein